MNDEVTVLPELAILGSSCIDQLRMHLWVEDHDVNSDVGSLEPLGVHLNQGVLMSGCP